MSPELFEAVVSAMFRLEKERDHLQKQIDEGHLKEVGHELVAKHLRDIHEKHWEAFNKFIVDQKGTQNYDKEKENLK